MALDEMSEPEKLSGNYLAADRRLFRLEEEFDRLIRLSRTLREARTDIMQNPVENSDTNQVKAKGSLDKYLNLNRKSKDLDEAIARVKTECELARSECNWQFAQARSFTVKTTVKTPGRPRLLRTPKAVATMWADLTIRDLYGAMEYETDAELLTQWVSLVRNIGLVVGAFGGSVAYTTLFSATRGRLDLVSWAFTCFVVLLINCSMYHSRPHPIPHSAREYFHSLRWQCSLKIALSLSLMMAAFVLLALSIALSDAGGPMVPGSHLAMLVAAYFPLGWIVVRAVQYCWDFFPGLKYHLFYGKIEACPKVPSHFVASDERWDLLPGGNKYQDYVKQRAVGCHPLPLAAKYEV